MNGYTVRSTMAPEHRVDKRLSQIQTGTLTDSRLNEDFVFWLKTKGLNYLLVILLIGCAYMGYQWWHRMKSHSRADAWMRLERASTPQELAVVAAEEGSVDSIALLAKIRAANTYLGSVVRGVRFDREPDAEDARLTPELRAEWLEDADRLFAEVAKALSVQSTPAALTPMAFHALMGRAAVAEARGDVEGTRRALEEAAARATGPFSSLAEVARQRGESVELVAMGIELPPREALPSGSAGGLVPRIVPGGPPATLIPPSPAEPVHPEDFGIVPFSAQFAPTRIDPGSEEPETPPSNPVPDDAPPPPVPARPSAPSSPPAPQAP